MRSLVLQAVYGGRGQTPGHFRKALIRGENPTRGVPTNSEGETESEGYTIDGYTSGALASDEEIGASSFNQGDVSDTNAPSTEIDIETREARVGPSSSRAIAPSPGYSEGDCEPLCTIRFCMILSDLNCFRLSSIMSPYVVWKT